ncbi:hypothetical protein FB45DRAFT_1031745 [Roridomyces roridus]|uniref:Uncharacterized protein n=1 Tax=Roridomyces roridus TaxID=1738132 RepID=A0AAD7FFX4_9AGAR|nr:hypothetical protein FB45DRAFT_1031745 [Roridomyces roridus]
MALAIPERNRDSATRGELCRHIRCTFGESGNHVRTGFGLAAYPDFPSNGSPQILGLGNVTITSDFPALPSLTSLTLKGVKFDSCATAMAVLSHLPLLQSLVLLDVTCGHDPAEDETENTLVVSHLLSLDLRPGGAFGVDRRIIFALQTQRLLVRSCPATFWSTISKYLRQSGPYLRSLELFSYEQLDEATSALDFSVSVNLERVTVYYGLHISYGPTPDRARVLICPALISLLSNIARYSTLHTVVLRIPAEQKNRVFPSWRPLSDLVALLKSPPFSACQKRFIVDGWSEDFERVHIEAVMRAAVDDGFPIVLGEERSRGLVGKARVFTTDAKAVQQFMTRTDI